MSQSVRYSQKLKLLSKVFYDLFTVLQILNLYNYVEVLQLLINPFYELPNLLEN